MNVLCRLGPALLVLVILVTPTGAHTQQIQDVKIELGADSEEAFEALLARFDTVQLNPNLVLVFDGGSRVGSVGVLDGTITSVSRQWYQPNGRGTAAEAIWAVARALQQLDRHGCVVQRRDLAEGGAEAVGASLECRGHGLSVSVFDTGERVLLDVSEDWYLPD